MASLDLLGALFAIAISGLLNIWFFTKKAHKSSAFEIQTTKPVSLPAGWWSSAERFQAERRAIFSQSWICISHRGRFKKPGDYIVYEVAGFRVLMILGKDKVVRSFHNVCRHRAFPVARKDSGTATILGCRYHGWSYDYTGRLIKAPYFDNKPGFDKSINGLFEINTKEDKNGFLYINTTTDPNNARSIPSEGIVGGKLINVKPDLTYETGNEFEPPTTISPVTVITRFFRTFFDTSEARMNMFPLTVVHAPSGSNIWYQITYNPVSAAKTSVRCDVYSTRGSENSQIDKAIRENLEHEVMQRIRSLEAEQKKATTFYDAVSTSHYQDKIASVVEAHVKQERLRGCEIRPAEVKAQPTDDITARAESPKQTKVSHRKSREGCRQCKALRTKCDEKKPSCTRCETRRVVCSGYSTNIRWSYKHELEQQRSKSSQGIAPVVGPTIHNNLQSPGLEFGSGASALQTGVSSTDGHRGRHEFPTTFVSNDNSTGPLLTPWDESHHLGSHSFDDNSIFYNLEDAALNGLFLQSEGADWLNIPLQDRVEELPRDLSPIPISDDTPDILRDRPSNGNRGEDRSQGQIISIPESSRSREIRDVSSSLSTYFFQDVLPRYCTWDSNSNIIRIITQAMWQSSGALHHTIQSMAASCLSNEIPYLSKIAAQERILALECVQKTPMGEDRLLADFLLGHTSCWVNPTDLVPNQFNELWATLGSYTSLVGTTSVVTFVQEALEYWTMVLSFITDTEQLGMSVTALPRTSGPLPLNSIITPNPFSGVTRGAVAIFTDTSRLIYKLRKRLPQLRFIRETDIDFLRETLNEAHQLEQRILGYSPLDVSTIVVLGDPHTTPEHFKILDEVFWYTSLLQLYRVFPDLLIQRYQPWNPQRILRPEAASHIPSRDEMDEWLMKLALYISTMLQGIPLDSRTRSIQAPVIVALSSELRYKSPDVSELDAASETDQQRAVAISTVSHAIEIARARRFVMSRLSIYWHVLPLQKVKKYQMLVKHIWEALDAGVPNVYWADMLSNNQLRTVMG
ncbi:hypothetical protein FLONG3_6311 [Fusarium longipes]|uniref:Zn(2)-C6 fungal-type domain-containing protein n=1 Tax=Fusarium longipes TaxID=694270 RepID=A0A395SMA1_9HYPO|nr:hypothetical protein FLONG3_6311 [Fusarium longipes]